VLSRSGTTTGTIVAPSSCIRSRTARTAVTTGDITPVVANASSQPTHRPARPSRGAGSAGGGGWRRAEGSRGSGPAMQWSRRAASATLRAIGPTWSSDAASGKTPSRDTRPHVGFRPTTPHQAAGSRIDAAVSVPSVALASPAAVAIAEPLDEPPAAPAPRRRAGSRAGVGRCARCAPGRRRPRRAERLAGADPPREGHGRLVAEVVAIHGNSSYPYTAPTRRLEKPTTSATWRRAKTASHVSR
jgi:hypothetical protein